jgi:hypothetical protein
MAILTRRLNQGGAFCLLGDYGDLYDMALGRTVTSGIDSNLEMFWCRYLKLRSDLKLPHTENSQIGCRWDLESTQLADWLISCGFREFHTTRVSWQELFTIENLLSIVENRCYSSMFTVREDLYSQLVADLQRAMSSMRSQVAASRHFAVARFFMN